MNHRDVTVQRKIVVAAALCVALGGCAPEQKPRTIADFEADRSALDAKLVSCRADRRAAIEDPECQSARTAANRIAMAEESERKARLEKDSQRQLDALRRRQAVADSQSQARQAALATAAEQKLANGLPLTDAEARALGIDPENSTLTRSGQAGAQTQPLVGNDGGTLRSNDAPPPVTSDARLPTETNDNSDSGGQSQAQPKSLAEIREALNEERESDDSTDDDE